MSAPVSQYVNVVSDTAVPLATAKALRRITINAPKTSTTVTVTETATANTVGIFDAAAARTYELGIAVDGLIITASDADLDVTVVYDG